MTKGRILVVEDENIVAMDIQNVLERIGYDVPAVASSGEAAILKARETKPDLVLMDITLKGAVDGVEAAEYMSRHLNVPVVFATAHADENTLQRAKLAEPLGYLVKPFDTSELRASIEMALHKHERQVLRNAAEHQQTGDALREMAERFDRIFNHSTDMIFLIDPSQDEILDANPIACWTVGYTREELLSMPVSSIYLNDMHKLKAFAGSVFEHGHAWNSKLTCVTKSGQLLSTETSAFAFDFDRRSCLVAMVRDVTDIKRGERDLRESNLRLVHRIDELTKLNALFREHLKASDEAEPRRPEVQQSVQVVLHGLQKMEDERQPTTVHGHDGSLFE